LAVIASASEQEYEEGRLNVSGRMFLINFFFCLDVIEALEFLIFLMINQGHHTHTGGQSNQLLLKVIIYIQILKSVCGNKKISIIVNRPFQKTVHMRKMNQ
jgi:hypothetical protein